MQRFIARENLKLFERKLAESEDSEERERLSALIEAERKHLRQLGDESETE